MNSILHVQLQTTPEQAARLKALQAAFAAVCNALAPIVRETRCWNRVTLHHLAYRSLRERFPQLGSQMVCNAIYSVSRMSRVVFQHPASPWQIARMGERPLPLLQFRPNSPVYFDRHTLSLRDGRLSMFTLDGRMHFDLDLPPGEEARFHREKLREVVLGSTPQGFRISFHFSALAADESAALPATADAVADYPDYLVVGEEPAATVS